MKRTFRVFCLILLGWGLFPSPPAVAVDSASEAGSSGHFLKAGEWVEYLLAYPADPLEAELAKSSDAAAAGGSLPLHFNPQPEAEKTWKVLQLRLEGKKEEARSLIARMTYPGGSMEVAIPFNATGQLLGLPIALPEDSLPGNPDLAGTVDPDALLDITPETDYVGDDGTAGLEPNSLPVEKNIGSAVMYLGDREVSVATRVWRGGPGGGIAVWTNPDLPFGFGRFASSQVDCILVDWGVGEPPDFPLDSSHILPPPGGLEVEFSLDPDALDPDA